MGHWATYEALRTATAPLYSPPDQPFSYVGARYPNNEYLVIRRNLVPVGTPDFKEKFERLMPLDSWKFHISVHPEDIPMAWDLIVECLQKKGVGEAKVITPEHIHTCDERRRDSSPNPNAGKAITLYTFKSIGDHHGHTPKEWQEIINGIEQRLAKAGIRPGPDVPTDNKVLGSMYCYYRSSRNTAGDSSIAGRAILLERPRDERYKEPDEIDPYTRLAINDPHMLAVTQNNAQDARFAPKSKRR